MNPQANRKPARICRPARSQSPQGRTTGFAGKGSDWQAGGAVGLAGADAAGDQEGKPAKSPPLDDALSALLGNRQLRPTRRSEQPNYAGLGPQEGPAAT